MKKFKPSLLTLGLLAAGVCSQQVYAQEKELTEREKAERDAATEIIEVRGFRKSVVKALNTKRFSDTVVDAISADDIGGLPDVSIADALARIPGVTAVRIDGQSSELNIRGLGGNFVMTTLNGREMVSSSGGRAVEFDQFPSELIQQAQVYKSQKADLIEGGVAGTVELQTINALDLDEESAFRFSVQGNTNSESGDNPDASEFGSRLTVSYQRKLFDDTLGIAVGYARLDQPAVSSRFVSYAGSPQIPGSFTVEDGALPTDADGNLLPVIVSSGFEMNQKAGDLVRDSFVGSINWTPTDDLRVTWDGFYTEFDSVQFDRGILVGESGGGVLNRLGLTSNIYSIQNPQFALTGGSPVLVGATFTRDPEGVIPGPPAFGGIGCNCLAPQVQNDNSSTFSKTLATGLQIEWNISDRLTATFDFSHSSAEEESVDEVLRLVMFEDSSAELPVVQDSITLDYQLNGLKVPNMAFDLDFTNLNQLMAASYERYPKFEENEANAARFDLKYELDNDYVTSLEFGMRYSEREYKLSRGVFRIGGQAGLTELQTRSGQYINYTADAEGNPVPAAIVLPYQLNESNTSVVNFSGPLAGLQSFRVVNDVGGLVNDWIGNANIDARPRWGIPNGVDANGNTIYRDPTPWSVTDGSTVQEDVLAAYVQANLNFEIGDIPVTGNVGLRAIDTSQNSLGLVNVGEGLGQPVADGFGNIRTDHEYQVRGDDYRHFLPTMNLAFQINDTDQIRFAYAKVLSRADLPDMRNAGAFTLGVGLPRTLPTGEQVIGNWVDLNAGGNPQLRPFEADQIDLSFERYFSETDGALTVALWNKDINNFTDSFTTPFFDFQSAGLSVPVFTGEDGTPLELSNGDYTRVINIDNAGYIRGAEIAYTQTFTFLPEIWAGLGVNLNFSYTESEIEVDSEITGFEDTKTPLPGLSRRVWTGTVFYEYEDFEARVSARFRSPYVDEQIAIGVTEQAFFDEETVVSAQMNYDITENLQVFASVDNLTDEPNLSFFGNRAQTGTLQYFGRHFYLGINYVL